MKHKFLQPNFQIVFWLLVSACSSSGCNLGFGNLGLGNIGFGNIGLFNAGVGNSGVGNVGILNILSALTFGLLNFGTRSNIGIATLPLTGHKAGIGPILIPHLLPAGRKKK